MEATCESCGVTVNVTNVSSAGSVFNLEYEMKPELSLASVCPVMIQRNQDGKPITDDGCPHLAAAVSAKVYA